MLLGKKIGPFAIEKEIGSGAMGTVYGARDVETGKRVAIKVTAPGLGTSETALARFKREAAILKQLDHPNIVRLVTTGRVQGTPFYAMEYVEGESLDHVMLRRGRISWEEVVTLGVQLCDALKHAHEKGIIHRDLKPSNVMVLPDGSLKLMDFGIAKALEVDLTALTGANSTVGTAAYMAPEQCRGVRDLTAKADLYSMGVMFYELLTGRKPFTADSPMEMFVLHVSGTFERPSRLVLDIPVWLDTLVCQLLEKQPDQRPFSAELVGQALDRVKEKVEAQTSAGVDTVRGRALGSTKLDETDKQAARTILGRKKKRKAREAFYRQRWFQGAALAGLLAAILFVLYVTLFKRPSAESLYEQAALLMAMPDPARRLEARQGPIEDYLRYYPDLADDRAKKMRRWADEVDGAECERLLLHRLRSDIRIGIDADEQQARVAVIAEDDGKVGAARAGWEKLAKFKNDENSEKRAYATMALGRLKLLEDVADLEKKLLSKITPQGFAADYTPASDQEKRIAQAFVKELAKSGDAHKTWEQIKRDLDRDKDKPELRPYFVLAAKRHSDLLEEKVKQSP